MSDRPHCLRIGACTAKTPGKHCVSCTSAMPEVRAKRSASIRAGLERDPARLERKREIARGLVSQPHVVEARMKACRSPEVRARHQTACQRSMDERMKDPAKRQRQIDGGLKRAAQGCVAVVQTPEARAKAAVAIRATALAWCPPAYWDLNAKLKRKGYRLPERKAMIADEIDRHSPAAEARRQIEDFNRRQRERVAREKAQAY